MTDEYAPEGGDLKKLCCKWLERIHDAEKRENAWIKDAEKAEAQYLCDDSGDTQPPDFNIIFSNVETIVPSIYNSTPAPDIRPRHNNRDGAGKMFADMLERAIAAQIDDGRLDGEIESLGQDAFLAGRGVTRVKFDADIDDYGVQNEQLLFENVSWRDYREGPASRWDGVPWVAFRHLIPWEEVCRMRDDEMWIAQAEPKEKEPDNDDETVWEVWDKHSRKVIFIAEGPVRILNMMEDPLGLSGFFPCPQPVQPVTATGKRCPVNPHKCYERLATELDMTTRRINAITKGLKLRGGIAAGAEAIEEMAKAGDNELVPIADLDGIAAMGGIDKAIVWWPIDKAIMVLRELYISREQTKQAIYEITGISDIVRGASNTAETATAQQIKTQWGSLRIKKMQRLVERHVRDLFILAAEVMTRHFSPQTLQAMAGMQVGPEVLAMLQQPLNHYRIDVESDSTVRADLTQKRGEMAEFLQGTAAFFGTMAPLVQQSPAAAAPVAEMFGAFARQFSLGKQAEDAIDQLVELAREMAKQPPPNPEQEMAKAEMSMKAEQMKAKMEEIRAKVALEVENLKLTGQEKQANIALKGVELQLKERELGGKEAQQVMDQGQRQFDNATKVAEIQIEREQKRAALIGG